MEETNDTPPKIAWYSINAELEPTVHDPVSYQEAVKIVDGYLARWVHAFEGGEEAIAATAFGFQRSEEEFVEICVNGPDEFSFRYEAPVDSWLGKLLHGLTQQDEIYHTREKLLERVRGFFEDPKGKRPSGA